MSKEKTGQPISVKQMTDNNFNLNAQRFIGSIIHTKAAIVKDAIIKELDIKESQFETILRKDAKKFTLAILTSKENSLLTEQYFFEGKYLFTLDIVYTQVSEKLGDDIYESPKSITVEYVIKKDIGTDIMVLTSGIESVELVKKEDNEKKI